MRSDGLNGNNPETAQRLDLVELKQKTLGILQCRGFLFSNRLSCSLRQRQIRQAVELWRAQMSTHLLS
jgi:hypothetical protein